METIRVNPSWDHPGDPLRHTWEGLVNIDQFRWLVRRDVQDQLRLAHAEIGARHVRAVGMFDDEMRVLGPNPRSWRGGESTLQPNFQLLDYVMDSLLDVGIAPMFTTSFMPGPLAAGERTVFTTRSRISPPKDPAAWADLVTAGVRHVTERYGAEVVRGWFFEVWNEPNLQNSFFEGTQEQFFRLWATTYHAIKAVDPDLRIGGPSTARAEWVADFLDYGRRHGCEPDFLIAHVYNNDSESSPLSPFDGPQEDRQSRSPHFAAGVVRGVSKLLDELSYRGEVHWNEWGRSWFPHHPDRETANEAAFICKTMAEVSQRANQFAYWCLSDVYDQVGYGSEAFHGNYGMLSLQGLRKPSYHAHQLLCMLGNRSHPIGLGDSVEGFGAMATSGSAGQSVLCWIYTPERSFRGDEVTVSVALPPNFAARPNPVRLFRISDNENNVLARWRDIGAPAILSRDQTETLRKGNRLTQAPPNSVSVEITNGMCRAAFTAGPVGVTLLQIDDE